MRTPLAQNDILQAIVRDALATEDAPITDVTMGTCLAAVSARHCGLASLVSHIAPGLARLQPRQDALPQSARELAATLADPGVSNTDAASLAMAAVNALLPAKVQSVEVNEAKHELVVRVTEEQSKLAFGKKAQNVRLCSKLIGWNITIRNEEPKEEKGSIRDQIRQAAARLAAELDISEKTANLLIGNGYVTVDGVKEAGRDTLLELEGVDPAEINHAFEHLDA